MTRRFWRKCRTTISCSAMPCRSDKSHAARMADSTVRGSSESGGAMRAASAARSGLAPSFRPTRLRESCASSHSASHAARAVGGARSIRWMPESTIVTLIKCRAAATSSNASRAARYVSGLISVDAQEDAAAAAAGAAAPASGTDTLSGSSVKTWASRSYLKAACAATASSPKPEGVPVATRYLGAVPAGRSVASTRHTNCPGLSRPSRTAECVNFYTFYIPVTPAPSVVARCWGSWCNLHSTATLLQRAYRVP